MIIELTAREQDLIIESRDADHLLENLRQIISERLEHPEGIEYSD